MTRLLCCLICLLSSPAWAVEFSSRQQQSTVVELYTSEGCSSCPPADRWLSTLKHDPRLFKTLIPLAFHVDYWDSLGWPDRFARSSYSQRQRQLAQQGFVSQVYTPGVIVNSQEWRAWFSGVRELPTFTEPVGELKANYMNGVLQVRFPEDKQYELHVAVLGMGLSSEVKAGENQGRRLQHDFVVLDMYQQTGMTQWRLNLNELPQKGQKQTALAIWLTEPESLQMIQAAAAFIDE